jgi:NAD(P)-dependent dehydrogenase (short-subunit alcohol dehydrogenase family)
MQEAAFDFKGKVALVTGGSRGIGASIAAALAERGARVLICGRKQENLDSAVRHFREQGLEAAGVAANVGDPEQVEELLATVEGTFGRLDILVNNVGMNILTPSVAEAEVALWNKILQTNLKRRRENYQYELRGGEKGNTRNGHLLRCESRGRNAYPGPCRRACRRPYSGQRDRALHGTDIFQQSILEQ